ncbi:MAG: L-threonylcarbamoyladenylate synthase, partial [Boseongicola sp.]|nr:L-threonylcarbamoyladenylate synthase [Boseongicola sp.]
LAAAGEIVELSGNARVLAEAFWPGALTLVAPLKPGSPISKLVTAGGELCAVRVPDHPVGHALLTEVGKPIAAPSANPSGRISPTTPEHVLAGLDGRIDAVIDGEQCQVGLESTIVGLLPEPTLLRAGGIPAEAIEACLGTKLATLTATDNPIAPGQLASHYAPSGDIRIDADTANDDEYMIGFGSIDGDVNLSPSGDLTEAAANLFSFLHAADATGKKIAVAPIPDTGLGRAINDRLIRAAAPRV